MFIESNIYSQVPQRSDPPSSLLSFGFLVVGGLPLGSGNGSADPIAPKDTTIASTANK